MRPYDAFYKRLIATMPLKNVTSRFAMERIKSTTAYPLRTDIFRDRRVAEGREGWAGWRRGALVAAGRG